MEVDFYRMFDFIEKHNLEIRKDDDAELGLYGYAVTTLTSGVIASGPDIASALGELEEKINRKEGQDEQI